MKYELQPSVDGHRYHNAPCLKCGKPSDCAYTTCSRCAYAEHIAERASGSYTGPEGRFWRLVDPGHPAHYYGWSSTKETADHFLRDPELPDAVRVEAAPQLTSYEAMHMDLAGPLDAKPFAAHQATQEYLLNERVPTIHQAD